MDRAMKKQTSQFHKIFFQISKRLARNAEKNITIEDKRNLTNFINVYANIYTDIICGENDSK